MVRKKVHEEERVRKRRAQEEEAKSRFGELYKSDQQIKEEIT